MDDDYVPFRCLECDFYSWAFGGCDMAAEDMLLSCPIHYDVPGNDYYDPAFLEVLFPGSDHDPVALPFPELDI